MEDSWRGRCDSLEAGLGFDREALTPGDHMTLDPEGPDPVISLEPTPAEVAQCEAEVGTLLSIIAELNKKMGSLKAPSDPGDTRSPALSRPLVPDLLSHRLVRTSPERNKPPKVTSKPPISDRGGAGIAWTKLQEVLSSLEDSISCRRTWAAPITASDQDRHRDHLRAAHENWTKSTQILDEMEKEFGISCPLSVPKDQNPEDVLDADKQESGFHNMLQSHQEELQRAQNTIGSPEEERKKLVGLHKNWRSGSLSPSYRSTGGPLSPDWASPPYPGSPLLHRRKSRAVTPLPGGVDGSPLGSVTSGSPCPSPIGLEPETERLNRYIERLKAKNERLTAALERKRSESEQINVALARLESDFSALQTALKYCEECEQAYSELLSLCDARRQQNSPLQTESADSDGQQEDSPSDQLRKMGTEELSTSFSSAGVTEETLTHTSHTGQRAAEPADRETVLRQLIERLKRDRAAVCLPRPGPEGKPSSDAGQPAGTRSGHVTRDGSKPPDTKREKASLFYELISVREEMSDLRGLIRLKEKELRCLEWGLMSQKAQEAAGVFIPENLREEVEDRKMEQQGLCDNATKAVGDGDVASPLTRPILKELQVVLQREHALKKRLALVHDSLGTNVKDGGSHRKEGGEQIARLTQAHSKALSSYRQICRKYREQVWRLEQKVATMMESQQNQSGATREAGEASEWRKEETVL
ncbi:uncharacterized protein ushbp1 [Cololabis saira]|uniref:uncharacterized protein ushbp1 n=1 Tax=Cololabis saira TaxID=129043 RepID=UPI002AD32E3F|nr:uncharacterized protein ushbp1 [Cololabis saira]